MAALPKETRGKFINSDKTGMEPADLWEITRTQPADFIPAFHALISVGWVFIEADRVAEGNKTTCYLSATDLPPICHSHPTFHKGEGEEKGKEEDGAEPPPPSDLDSEILAAEGKYLESLSARVAVSVQNIKEIAEARGISQDVLNAWAMERAANGWRRPNHSPVVESTWFPDLESFNRKWERNDSAKNRKSESNSNRGTANEGKAGRYAI